MKITYFLGFFWEFTLREDFNFYYTIMGRTIQKILSNGIIDLVNLINVTEVKKSIYSWYRLYLKNNDPEKYFNTPENKIIDEFNIEFDKALMLLNGYLAFCHSKNFNSSQYQNDREFHKELVPVIEVFLYEDTESPIYKKYINKKQYLYI